MSSIAKLFVLLSAVAVNVLCEEKFCSKDRSLLLGGVFNYDKLVFTYSWKEPLVGDQMWLVWRFEIKSSRMVAIGKAITMKQIFPSIPLFKTGFGLTIKCDKNDQKCNSYRQLVFIFFQTTYIVFRFSNDVFAEETDPSRIPWGLKPRGEIYDWFSSRDSIDAINAIVLLSGYQSQLFIVTMSSLMVSPVDLSAAKPKWTEVAKSNQFNAVLGGFVADNILWFNKNEPPENILLKYDQNGKELEKISVWKYFNCDGSQGPDELSGRVAAAEERSADSERQSDDDFAKTLLIGIGVAIVVTNLVAVVFWVIVYRKNRDPNESFA